MLQVRSNVNCVFASNKDSTGPVVLVMSLQAVAWWTLFLTRCVWLCNWIILLMKYRRHVFMLLSLTPPPPSMSAQLVAVEKKGWGVANRQYYREADLQSPQYPLTWRAPRLLLDSLGSTWRSISPNSPTNLLLCLLLLEKKRENIALSFRTVTLRKNYWLMILFTVRCSRYETIPTW